MFTPILLQFLSCANAEILDPGIETGSDGDTDTDTDGDSDSDADADSDTDTDSDTTPECDCTETSDCCDGCYTINESGACEDGDLCVVGETCTAGECSGGEAPDCTGLGDQCNLGECNPVDGECMAVASFEAEPCDDGNSCTADEVCTSGECIDADGTDTLFFEDFSDNSAGWTLDTQWAIGAAVASTACSTVVGMFQDPALDHTEPTSDNGIAGVVIGGCTGTTVHTNYCITSPVIDTSGLTTLWISYYRWLNSDYDPYMHNSIDVFNGSSWVNIFLTGSSPATTDSSWTYFEYDITAHISAATQVRWCYDIGSSGVFDSSGWNIDDVNMGPVPCGP